MRTLLHRSSPFDDGFMTSFHMQSGVLTLLFAAGDLEPASYWFLFGSIELLETLVKRRSISIAHFS
jgi:hypothetical protein